MHWEKITKWQHVAKALKLNKKLPDVSSFPEEDREWVLFHWMLVKFVEAVNGNWDWHKAVDGINTRHYLWPDLIKDESSPSGLGLSGDGNVNSGSYTSVGARLELESREKLEHVWENGKQWYAAYLLKPKKKK